MTEKFILVSLDEKKSKELAEIISNDTSRKILDYLSEKEATASDISKDLKIPLSTVEYNLKNLLKSDLIEAEEFKWSPKGRQMDIFKVKKKYIVITPEKNIQLIEIIKKVLPVGIFGVMVAGIIEYFSGSRILKIPLTKEIITKTVGERGTEVAPSAAAGTSAMAESSKIVTGPIVNVTSQVTETIREVVLPNPHYGLWFLFGIIFAILILFLINLGRKK